MNLLPLRSPVHARDAASAVSSHLAAGGIVGHPTETVYGLGGRATDHGVEALTRLKGRDPDKPFLLLVAGRAMAEAIGIVFTAAGAALAAACWPGPLTLVLPCTDPRLPVRLRGATGGVAVRWTSHNGLAALIAMLGVPLTSTSANRSGEVPMLSAQALAAAFPDDGSLLVLDGGLLAPSAPSTVVDCTGEPVRLVREGAISVRELRERAGRWAP